MSDEREENTMTLMDNEGRKYICDVQWVQRFVGKHSTTNQPHQVLLTFDTATEAKDAFHFVWSKVMKRKLSWLKGAKH